MQSIPHLKEVRKHSMHSNTNNSNNIGGGGEKERGGMGGGRESFNNYN